MNKLNKLALLTIAGIITCSTITPIAPAKKITVDPKTIVAIQIPKESSEAFNLEAEMFKCAERHLKYLSDTTIGNIKSKLAHIESLRKELLALIIKADKHERSKYSHLEAILTSFNIQEVFRSIQDFKQIIQKLPKETSGLIKSNLKDPAARTILGLA